MSTVSFHTISRISWTNDLSEAASPAICFLNTIPCVSELCVGRSMHCIVRFVFHIPSKHK